MPRSCGASLKSSASTLLVRAVVAIVVTRSALVIVARAAVAASPPMQRETVSLIVVVAVLVEPLIAWLCLLCRRLLATGNERRQPVDVAATVMCARLVCALHQHLLLRLIVLLLRERLRIARQIGLRLARSEWHLANDRLLIALVLLGRLLARAARRVVFGAGEMWIVLAKLLLRRRDQTVVVLRVLVIVFRRDRIAGGLGIARKLNVFLGNVRWISTNFDVGTVRFVNTRHRIVVLAVAMLIVTVAMAVIAAAHALVLTVSHDSPVC